MLAGGVHSTRPGGRSLAASAVAAVAATAAAVTLPAWLAPAIVPLAVLLATGGLLTLAAWLDVRAKTALPTVTAAKSELSRAVLPTMGSLARPYRPTLFLTNGHVETIFAALCRCEAAGGDTSGVWGKGSLGGEVWCGARLCGNVWRWCDVRAGLTPFRAGVAWVRQWGCGRAGLTPFRAGVAWVRQCGCGRAGLTPFRAGVAWVRQWGCGRAGLTPFRAGVAWVRQCGCGRAGLTPFTSMCHMNDVGRICVMCVWRGRSGCGSKAGRDVAARQLGMW
eukprot:365433-Chlamydomonas_euryale.AAC.4